MTKYQKNEPGEWQTDTMGKRYRMVGSIKEYEMTVNIGGTEVPESQVEEFNARQKAAIEAQRNAEKEKTAALPKANCPFLTTNKTTCKGEECALYVDGCALARLTKAQQPKETAGLQCPFSRYAFKCRKDCALYKNGCALTATKIKQQKARKTTK